MNRRQKVRVLSGSTQSGGGCKDWFRVGGLSTITDPYAAISTNKHVPALDSKTEENIRICCAVMFLEQSVDDIGVNIFI